MKASPGLTISGQGEGNSDYKKGHKETSRTESVTRKRTMEDEADEMGMRKFLTQWGNHEEVLLAQGVRVDPRREMFVGDQLKAEVHE